MGHFLRNPGTSRAEMQTGGQKGWVVAAPAEGRSADTGLWGWGGGLDGAGRRAREAGASSMRGPGTLTPGVPSRGPVGTGGRAGRADSSRRSWRKSSWKEPPGRGGEAPRLVSRKAFAGCLWCLLLGTAGDLSTAGEGGGSPQPLAAFPLAGGRNASCPGVPAPTYLCLLLVHVFCWQRRGQR